MMLLVGELSANRELIVTLDVLDDTEERHTVRCLLNTGFGGYLTLSTSAVEVLGLPFAGDVEFELAGVPPRSVRRFRAVVEWQGELVTVSVLEVEGLPLVGMRLLYGSDLHAHLIDGGFATLAAL
ncbi:MAG: hypothetical protein H7Y38_10790 [Armatimonadetes bacterium]|nr:hypothetical protein [Armatimonadota bacterium]